jgi:hypothetical protein
LLKGGKAGYALNVYENPEEFDVRGFYKLRQRTPEDDMRYQLTSTSSTQMHFVTRSACASRELAREL